MATSWKSANKFRLFMIVLVSLLVSFVGINAAGLWTMPAVITSGLNACLAGAAFLQCPGDRAAGPS